MIQLKHIFFHLLFKVNIWWIFINPLVIHIGNADEDFKWRFFFYQNVYVKYIHLTEVFFWDWELCKAFIGWSLVKTCIEAVVVSSHRWIAESIMFASQFYVRHYSVTRHFLNVRKIILLESYHFLKLTTLASNPSPLP